MARIPKWAVGMSCGEDAESMRTFFDFAYLGD